VNRHEPDADTSTGTEHDEGTRWFGVRCVFKTDRQAYEERVTVWRSASFAAAIEKAEAEAVECAAGIGFEYLGLAQAYDTQASDVVDGSEVFSLIRRSDLDADQYIQSFFATGGEHERQLK
jgi:hypothetical protein